MHYLTIEECFLSDEDLAWFLTVSVWLYRLRTLGSHTLLLRRNSAAVENTTARLDLHVTWLRKHFLEPFYSKFFKESGSSW